MEYWVIQHNRSDISSGYQQPSGIPPNMGCWRINRFLYRVREDDIAFIWYSNSSSRIRDRGIYNVSTVYCRPDDPKYHDKIQACWGPISANYNDKEKLKRLESYPAILTIDQYSNDFAPYVSLEELESNGFSGFLPIRAPKFMIHSVEQAMGENLLSYIRRTRGWGKLTG